ncbi:MAG: sugar nucleotide-binding protein [Planctomycetota bacterium]|nr:sugar nucleotide-binding protein [Planctomycetota bacterium]
MDGTTLVFGAGWIGTQLVDRLPGAVLTTADIADEPAVRAAIEAHRPARVVNCAGKTGNPNVDSCEAEPDATYRSNVAGPVLLAALCMKHGIHMTHFGSGCIYSGDNDGRGFSEDDAPNYTGSLYSRTKLLCEAALKDLNVLQLRLRLPMASTPGPRNLLTKLLSFREVVSIPNSITVLDDVWAPAAALMERGATGIWNMVNPGAERHDDVLRCWQERVDPEHTFALIPEAELAKRLTAARSNCILSTQKLDDAGLGMPLFEETLPRLIDAYARAQTGAHA